MGAIGSVFGGVGKMFKSVLYILGGKSDKIGEIWAAHPDAIHGAYQEVIKEKKERILRIKDAVTGIQTLHDQKVAQMKEQVKEQENDKDVQSAIVAELQEMVGKLKAKGMDQAAIEADANYRELMSHYADISDTIVQREARITELDEFIKNSDREIEDYVNEIKQHNRDLDAMRQESQQAKVDIELAREQQMLNDLKSGLASNDSAAEDLRELRTRVQKIKSGAKVSKMVAGTDNADQRRRLVEKHKQSRTSKELSQLLFQAGAADKDAAKEKAPEAEKRTALPE